MKGCEGCLVKENLNTNELFNKKMKSNCPCKTCILKCMCTKYCGAFLKSILTSGVDTHYKKSLKKRLAVMKHLLGSETREDIVIYSRYYQVYKDNETYVQYLRGKYDINKHKNIHKYEKL